MAAANQTLASEMEHRPAHEFDVEHVARGENGEELPHVEMDLACGVLELRTEEAAAAAERALASGAAVELESDSESDSGSERESDEPPQPRQEKPAGKLKRSRIEVLK